MAFINSTRTVLLISDLALYIYDVGARDCQLVEIVPWTTEDFEQNVHNIISKECGNKPLLILNDMVEQHYRKEKIPKVGILDKSNVVDRKLLITFPSYPIRAALPLKEKLKTGDKKTSGDIYIFAAAPVSEPFTKTLSATKQSTASISGFFLLPVESSGLVKKLSEKLFSKQKAKWTVFIGQHQSGGLRQIVTKNGELALTRMTPVGEAVHDVDQWTSEVQQEFKATMSYLTRFGFDSSDGLNIILISSHEAGEKFAEQLDTPCNYKNLTVAEAAKFLGLKIDASHEDVYADCLHAAWAGTRTSFIMPMKIKDLDRVSKPRQISIALSVLLAFALVFQMYQSFGYSQSLYNNTMDIDTAVKKKAGLDVEYQKEVKRKEELGFDIQLMQSSLNVKANIDKRDIDTLDLFYRIGASLPKDMRIDKIDIQRAEVKPLTEPPVDPANIPPQTLYTAVLQMSFPSTMDAEKGNKIVEDLKNQIQKSLIDSNVKITKLLEDYQYSEGLVLQTGVAAENKAKTDYVAEIKIEKLIK